MERKKHNNSYNKYKNTLKYKSKGEKIGKFTFTKILLRLGLFTVLGILGSECQDVEWVTIFQ